MLMLQKVVVVGLGYVGLPLAIRAAEAGHKVIGIDNDEHRIKMLDSGESYVNDIPDKRIQSVLRSGQLRATSNTSDASGFTFAIIAVPTPLREGAPDLAYVRDAATTLAAHLRPGATVILESTSYPGTTDDIVRPILEWHSGLKAGTDFHLGFSPERIDPGNRHWRLENTPKLISGTTPAALARISEFYGSVVEQTVEVSSTRTAELAKLLENTFRQVNIALINELAQAAEALGCDLWEAVAAAATKPFGYMPFTPGPGVGGHCLPVDSAYLSWQVNQLTGYPVQMIELARVVNESMPAYVISRLAADVPLDGKRVLLLGLAYKKNSADLRESPSLEVARLLAEAGALVRVCDPVVPARTVPGDLHLVAFTEDELATADAVVLLTDHDCFDYQLIERASKYVFDTRNRCQGNVTKL